MPARYYTSQLLQEYDFILNDVLDAHKKGDGLSIFSKTETDITLASIADFVKREFIPLLAKGDEEGTTRHADGTVTLPKEFKDVYRKFYEQGFGSMLASAEYGGMEAPHYLVGAANEMFNTNFPLGCTQGLTAGASQVIEEFATPEIKNFFLNKFNTGEWSCTMCLTEANHGSDAGDAKTQAIPTDDGKFLISGAKIFITSGKHDLTDNICHLVLARLPGAPEGSAGISLFLVSEKKIGADGALGDNNGVSCAKIEEKMGIHASATCEILFNNAEAVLIGKPNEGMKAMFVMMNDERINVATQGLATAELSFQNAALYATERPQGPHIVEKAKETFTKKAAPPVKIIEHANIQKDLIDIKAQIDGWRTLIAETALNLFLSKKHPDENVRKEAKAYAELMTPVLKACVTDFGVAAAQKCIQMHGGMGFIKETGVEQFYRDGLIATIYEGTNEIQSMDFTFRKSKNIPAVSQKIMGEVMSLMSNPALAPLAPSMMTAAKIFQETATGIQQKASDAAKGQLNNLEDILVHSRDFMDMFGKMAVGVEWLKIMNAAAPKAATETPGQSFYGNKMEMGQYFIESIMLPEMKRLGSRIKAGADHVRKIDVKALVPVAK